MNAVILAAGQGLRIRDTHRLPKGFIEVGDKAIILESIEILKNFGINKILIVTGYEASAYDNLAKQTQLFQTIHNEHYATSGSLYSLYCAREWIDDDFLLLESDLIYEARAIQAIYESSSQDVILVSSPTQSTDEVYVAAVNNCLVAMSKQRHTLEEKNIIGEFVGINKISLSTYKKLISILEKNPTLLYSGHYEEDGLVALSKQQIISCLLLNNLLWCEIDNLYHLNRARKIYRHIQALSPVKQQKRNILLNPGPVTTSETVKQALKIPDICHREREFTDLLFNIRQDLLKVVHAEENYTSLLFSSSGTGAIEACISSIIPPSQKILIINNGSYGQRMLDICKRYGIQTVELKYTYNQTLPLNEIEQLLCADKNIKYVGLVHHETSSGILNPLTAIGEICNRLNRLLIVDAMSSFAGSEINVNTDHIAFLIASSNKCVQGMPGAAFVIAKIEKLLETEGNARSFYFDLHQQYHSLMQNKELPFTPPVQIIYALKQALHELFIETLAGRVLRYRTLYTRMIRGLQALGFQSLTPENYQSQLLAMIQFPNDGMEYSFEHFHHYLYQKGYVIYPRKLDIKNTFRVACIGDLSIRDIEQFLMETKNYISRIRNEPCQTKV